MFQYRPGPIAPEPAFGRRLATIGAPLHADAARRAYNNIPTLAMNPSPLLSAISTEWDTEIVPQLTDYVRIPAKSPHFDPQWETNGSIERVIRLADAWVRKQPVRGLAVEILRLPGRTPLLYFDVPGSNKSDRTVLLYGHLDKQPEMTGWRE